MNVIKFNDLNGSSSLSQHASIEDLSSREVLCWSADELTARTRRPFTISDNSSVAVSPQHILFPEHLSAEQKRVVRRLHQLKTHPRLLRRACRKRPETSQELSVDGLEVGAFLIRLRNRGSVVGIHTSSEVDGIDASDALKSVNGLMIQHAIEPDEITGIDYFHTHPARKGQIADPLSADDEKLIALLKRQLRHVLREQAPAIHCYAIGALNGLVFLYAMTG